MERGLVSAGHDVSSGGLVTTILEMVMSGDAGVKLQLSSDDRKGSEVFLHETLFAEELGLVIEVRRSDLPEISALLKYHLVPNRIIGEYR